MHLKYEFWGVVGVITFQCVAIWWIMRLTWEIVTLYLGALP